MARHALRAAGDAISLHARVAVFDDIDAERFARVGDERGFRLRRIPPVADPVTARGVLDDEPRLNPLCGGGIAAGGLEVEMLHPDGAVRERPRAIAIPR